MAKFVQFDELFSLPRVRIRGDGGALYEGQEKAGGGGKSDLCSEGISLTVELKRGSCISQRDLSINQFVFSARSYFKRSRG